MVESVPPDHYATLGLTKDASAAQVKTAYKKAALKHHPDKAQDKETSADQFHRISLAYETLVDDDKRRKYEDSLKFAQLKRNIEERRAGGPGSTFGGSPLHSRGPSGDVKFNASQRSPYTGSATFSQSRVYEERRPRDRSWDEDYAPRQEENRASSRKYPEYMSSPKQPSRSASFRQDIRRSSRDDRPSKSKASAKKQQDRDIRQVRQHKHFYAASVDSDYSDSEDDLRTRRREEWDYDQVRRSQATRRDRSDEQQEDRYSNKAEQAREYMSRFRPVSLSPPSYGREAFDPHQSTRDRTAPEPRRDSYELRPGIRRVGSTKHADVNPSITRSRTTLNRETSGAPRGSRTPEEERRPPPPPRMHASVSSPAGDSKITAMFNNNARRATAPDESNKAARQMPRRSETVPNLSRSDSMKPASYPIASTRRRSEQQQTSPSQPPLHGPSHLRQQENNNPNNNDSGYSTSNSPSEEVLMSQENVAPSKKQTYRYDSGSKSANHLPRSARAESDSSDGEDVGPTTRANTSAPRSNNSRPPVTEIRVPNGSSGRRLPQMSRSPSPIGEKEVRRSRANSASSIKHQVPHAHTHSTAADRAAGPPPSSSAKYAHEHYATPSSTAATHGSASERERERERDYPPRPTSRRPSFSGRAQSTPRVATLSRANTVPVPPTINTDQTPSNRSREALFFGEIPTASPVEMHRSDGEGRFSGPSDREGREKDKRRGRHNEGRRGSKRDEVSVKMGEARAQIIRDALRERSPRIRVRA